MVNYDKNTPPTVTIVTLPCAQAMKDHGVERSFLRWTLFMSVKNKDKRYGEGWSSCGRSGQMTKTEKLKES